MRLGADISTYNDELAHGAKYYRGDSPCDPLDEFSHNGVDIARIRLWADPQSEDGKPYLGGNCDLENFIRLAKMCREKGFSILLDIHYSDFWTDPQKQMIPKAWKGMELGETADMVYEYTVSVLNAVKENGIELYAVQIGNEITNGMLWPLGKLEECENGPRKNYDGLVTLLKAGCRAAREICPRANIVIHLERSYDKQVYDEFFTNITEAGLDFDCIGMSYYPYWHGTFDMFFENAEMCKKFKKSIWVVEFGYAFTLEDYLDDAKKEGSILVNKDNVSTFQYLGEYPITPKGQAEFTNDFLKRAEKTGIEAVIWWEPLWIPGDGICWSSREGMEYIGEGGKSTRNEWANQCLFDYSGRMLPAFDVFSES